MYPNILVLINKRLPSPQLHFLNLAKLYLYVLNLKRLHLDWLLAYWSVDSYTGRQVARYMASWLPGKFFWSIHTHVAHISGLLESDDHLSLCKLCIPEVFLYSVSISCDTVILVVKSNFGVIVVVTWAFFGTEVVLSIGMVFCMPSSSMVMTWLYTSKTVNGFDVCDSSQLYLVDIFLSSTINASRKWSMWTCFSIVKVGKVWKILSKYRLYLVYCFAKYVKLGVVPSVVRRSGFCTSCVV